MKNVTIIALLLLLLFSMTSDIIAKPDTPVGSGCLIRYSSYNYDCLGCGTSWTCENGPCPSACWSLSAMDKILEIEANSFSIVQMYNVQLGDEGDPITALDAFTEEIISEEEIPGVRLNFEVYDPDAEPTPAIGQIDFESAETLELNRTIEGNNYESTNNVDQYRNLSWNMTGPEKVYTIEVPEDIAQLDVRLSEDSENDLEVFILGTEGADDCRGFGFDYTALLEPAPGTYYVVVDGYEGAQGEYGLTVSTLRTSTSITLEPKNVSFYPPDVYPCPQDDLKFKVKVEVPTTTYVTGYVRIDYWQQSVNGWGNLNTASLGTISYGASGTFIFNWDAPNHTYPHKYQAYIIWANSQTKKKSNVVYEYPKDNEASFKINNTISAEPEIFCAKDDLYLDASSSTCADNYFVSVENSDSGRNRLGGEESTWLSSSDEIDLLNGTFNLTNFASSHFNGFQFLPGNYYFVTVAIGPNWNAMTKWIYIEPSTAASTINGSANTQINICPDENIILGGSGCNCADGYYVSVRECDAAGNGFGYEHGWWLANSQVTNLVTDNFDLKAFCNTSNPNGGGTIDLLTGHHYLVKLQVGPQTDVDTKQIYITSAKIQGMTWLEQDVYPGNIPNHIMDPFEQGLQGCRAMLHEMGTYNVQHQITDTYGNFEFNNLHPAMYRLYAYKLHSNSGWRYLRYPSFYTINLACGDIVTEKDFGLYAMPKPDPWSPINTDPANVTLMYGLPKAVPITIPVIEVDCLAFTIEFDSRYVAPTGECTIEGIGTENAIISFVNNTETSFDILVLPQEGQVLDGDITLYPEFNPVAEGNTNIIVGTLDVTERGEEEYNQTTVARLEILAEGERMAIEEGKILGEPYPTPGNPNITIPFNISAKAADVTLNIYDLTGRLIKTLVNGEKSEGYHSVVWNGIDDTGKAVSSGVYLSRIEVDGKSVETNKLLLLK